METLDLRSAPRLAAQKSIVTHLCTEEALFPGTCDFKQDRRVWSFLYPESSIHCWSSNSKTQLKSISLNSFIPSTLFNLDKTSPCCIFPDATFQTPKSLGYVTFMNYLEDGGLYLGTSTGHLLRSTWPIALIQMKTNQPVRSWLSQIHKPATQTHHCVLIGVLRATCESSFDYSDPSQRLISIGNGFFDPLSPLNLGRSLRKTQQNKAVLVTMFDDEFFNS
ncbi:hypothetical protein Ciccas_014088 [Cichlidogyrus casuarinus]|uniref:Uncharacterized protein n=1 Tax=Cichlidogyrus casuarinus TaxID=1844966 RepID=A0ABD2PKD1_9PLAT